MEKIIWLVVLTLSQAIYALIQWKRNGKKTIKYNPHPPGEAKKCEEHSVAIGKLETEIEGMGKRLDRIEVKLNGRGK